jgi:hypothetical protein
LSPRESRSWPPVENQCCEGNLISAARGGKLNKAVVAKHLLDQTGPRRSTLHARYAGDRHRGGRFP